MSSTYVTRPSAPPPLSTDEAKLPRIRFDSPETDWGRLLPMQQLLVEHLKQREVKHPIILDIGIGMGAPTLVDLANELTRTGFKSGTIIGIDASPRILQATRHILDRLRSQGEIPNDIKILLEYGDICSEKNSRYSPLSILQNHFPGRTLADLCLSSNLVLGLQREPALHAIESMRDCVSDRGLVVLGAGYAESTLNVTIYDKSSPETLGSVALRYGDMESDGSVLLRTILQRSRER